MRQAGRYLPEYNKTRARAGSFMSLCKNPELACEVTLQPIDRYGFDAAILFSDILIVPYGLGMSVDFVEGKGPVLDAISDSSDIKRLDSEQHKPRIEATYETVRLCRDKLSPDKALIGFAGSPWTVATYMIEGGASKNYAKAVEKSLFYFDTRHRCFRFTDQMILPKNMSEAKFLHTIAEKLENSPSRYDYDHNEGELFIVNNKFWVHGRRRILSETGFNRELLRIRGHFC